MPTLYTSNRLPSVYAEMRPGDIVNGSLARASLPDTIANNQVYLACGVTPLINFYMAPGGVGFFPATPGTGWAWSDESRTIPVFVPPFCTHAEFYFYAFKQFDETAPTNLSYIEITGNAARRITHIPAGENDDYTGKTSPGGPFTGAWVRASGIGEHPLDTDPGAVPLVASASNTWQRVAVTIEVTEFVYVRAAAYHVLPGRETYTITY